jgi:Domain of unknown function (DUF932)
MNNHPQKLLNWDIKIQPLKTITGLETGTRAIMRNDNNTVLSYVSKLYQPLPNRELIKLCRAIEKTGNYRIEGYEEFQGGKLVMAFIRNLSPGLKLNGLELAEYFVVGNSHDKSRKLFIGTTQNLIRCANQFSSVTPMYKAIHRGRFEFHNQIIHELRDQYEAGRKSLYANMEALEKKKVNQDLINKMVIYLLNTDRVFPDRAKTKELLASSQGLLLQKSISRETRELGMNAFGLLNGVTWYSSHEIRNPGKHFGNISGLAKDLNDKAFHFCNELIS